MGYTRFKWTAALALLVIVATLFVSGCGGGSSGSSSSGSGTPDPALPGYLSNAKVDGKFVRWTRMPISVFFDTSTTPDNWNSSDVTMFQSAMNDWSSETNGTITFKVIDQETTPFIHVKWVKDSPLGDASAAGVAKFSSVTIDNKQYFQRVDIEIATTGIDGVPYSALDQRIIALHELGHALGLWGHSDSPMDIMYGGGPIQTFSISSRDALTMNALYARPADVNEAPVGRVPEREGPIVVQMP